MSAPRILVFGHIRIVAREGAEPMVLQPAAARTLAILAASGPGGISGARLISELWDGAPPATAASSMRNKVREIRRHLPAGIEIPHSKGGLYRLDCASGDVDFWHLQRLIEDDLVPTPFDISLLCAAPPFQDVVGRSADSVISGAEETARILLPQLIRQFLERGPSPGTFDGAVAQCLLGALRDVALFDDGLANMILTAVDHAGYHSQAAAALQNYTRRFEDEMGFRPSHVTPQLVVATEEGQIRAQTMSKLPPALAQGNLQPLIGRETELAEIEEAHVALVVGPRGVGKSRLLAAVGANALESGSRVAFVTGRTAKNLPLGPWASGFPDVARKITELGGDPLAANVALRCWTAISDHLAESGRWCVIVDDAQMLDEASAQVLKLLVHARSENVSIVVAGNSHFSDEAWPGLVEDLDGLGAERIVVRNLGLKHVRAIAALRFASADGASLDAFSKDVLQCTQGNSDAVHAVIGACSEPFLDLDGDALLKIASSDTYTAELSPAALEVGAAASVIGFEFALEQLLELLQESQGEILAGLEELWRAQLIVELSSRDQFRFCHVLVQATLMHWIPSFRRVRLRHAVKSAVDREL